MSHFTVAVFTPTGAEVDELLAPFQEGGLDECPMDYLEFEEDDDYEVDDIKGIRGYWFNPNAKWDWYSIGGRWGGLLLVDGKKCDHAFASQVDWYGMEQARLKELEPFENCSARKWYKPEYFQELYPTEEDYINANTMFSTYAVITPDGEWHAPGEMGWFGCSSESPDEGRTFKDRYWKNFIEPAIKNNWHITIVDCHI